MPSGPHVPSVGHIRTELDKVHDAIRYDDPSTDERGTGDSPAVAVWISDPDRQGEATSTMESNSDPDGPNTDEESGDTVVDQPVIGRRSSPGSFAGRCLWKFY